MSAPRFYRLLVIGSDWKQGETRQQIFAQIVRRHTLDLLRVHNRMLAAPLQAKPLGCAHEVVAADDENPCEMDGPLAEACLEFVAVPPVVEFVEPVNNLAVAVVEPPRPLSR